MKWVFFIRPALQSQMLYSNTVNYVCTLCCAKSSNIFLIRQQSRATKIILLINWNFGIKPGSAQIPESNPSLNVFYSDCAITHCAVAPHYNSINNR